VKFLADQCVWGKTIKLLREEGHKVITLKELGAEKAPDEEVLKLAFELDAVLVTNDTGFGNVLTYPPSTHKGVILLRLTKRTEAYVHKVLRFFVGKVTQEELKGALVVIGPRGYRIRRTGVREE